VTPRGEYALALLAVLVILAALAAAGAIEGATP